MLQRGEGDLVAASLTITPERAQVAAFSRPYLTVREQVVQRAGDAPLTALSDLKGRTLHVRPSSSYAGTLARLQPQLGFQVALVSEDTEVEDLLADVAEGTVPLTVADSHFLQAEQLVRKNLRAGPELTEDRPLAFAVRKENPKLLAALDRWLERSERGLEFNMYKRRAFGNAAQARAAHFDDVAATGRLSRWDPLLKRMGERYRFDWRFLAAQAFRESHFDAQARSFAGALGLFQVMPATGRELGYLNLLDPEQGAQAGVSYLSGLLKRIEPEVGLDDRLRFALAAYNAGFTRLEDARRIARELRWDPNVWKDNVEKAYGLLARPQYARRSRAGFCRCQEPIDYVNLIEGNYRTWLQLLPER
jgi:membrane-bound lytic murein transglycosylase F